MAKVIFEVPTIEQAEELAKWYEGSGEQDALLWFEIKHLDTPFTDVQRKGGFMKVEGDAVTVYCK